MEKTAFDHFINSYDLHSFLGLIENTLNDQTSYKGVWITTILPLGWSHDGVFVKKNIS